MWGWIALILGGLYGYFSPGRQNKSQMFKTGLLWGAIIALVFAVIGFFVDMNPLGFGYSLIANIISIVIILALFLLGVWIGDLLEDRFRKNDAAVTTTERT